MKLILCLDKKGGMLFNHRRLSQDRQIMVDMSRMIGDQVVYMNDYSYQLYQSLECQNIIVEEGFRNQDGYCLVEEQGIAQLPEYVDEVIIYNFNRQYPADLKFDMSLLQSFEVKESYDFVGHSHDSITKTIYVRGNEDEEKYK